MQISLKAARVNANFTLETVGRMVGVSTKTISNWEKGETPIPANMFEKLCELYSADQDYVKVPVVRNEDYNFF